jgi:flagellar motor switch protein FliM
MTEVLSQEEIDQLLTAISAGEVSQKKHPEPTEHRRSRSTTSNDGQILPKNRSAPFLL